MKCPICESRTLEKITRHSKKWAQLNVVHQGSFDLIFCLICNVYFAYPLPSAEFLVEHYAKKNKSEELIKQDTKFRSEQVYPEYFEVISQALKLEGHGKVLEIGCYSGEFLKRFDNLGYDCWGLDLHPGYLDYCRKHFNLKVSQGTVFDFNFDECSFDFVIFHQLLEHLADPNSFLKEIYRILKEDGFIFLSVPSTFGVKFNVDMPNHLFYYSEKSLRFVLEKHNFESLVLTLNLSKKGLIALAKKKTLSL